MQGKITINQGAAYVALLSIWGLFLYFFGIINEIVFDAWMVKNVNGLENNRFITTLYKRIIRSCLGNRLIAKVVLFGSRARGDFHQTSDIDLAIYTSDATHSQQNLIEFNIKQITTPLKIDILFITRLTKEKLITSISKDGMIIYEQGKALRKA